MTSAAIPGRNIRNRNYYETHQRLIETAADLIAGSGADGVSVSALARVTGMNRATIYYHFENREDIMSAAETWSREQLENGANGEVSRWMGIDQISGLMLSNPEVITSWVDDCIAFGDIRERYPQWDRLVARIGNAFAELSSDEPCDAEDYWTLMLAGAFSVPRSFTSPAHQLEGLERMLECVHAKALEHAAG